MTGERQTFPLLGLRRGIGVFGRERRSTHRGSGYEMASSRPYQPSDNMRAIDWGASARLSSARGSDEFIVREHFSEESPRIVVFVDRRPAMRLYSPELPWLHKPAAVRAAGRMIVDSALAAQGLAGYLDLADAHAPRWLPPRRQFDVLRIRDHELPRTSWTAPEDNLARGFDHLVQARQDMPRGTFVFVLSDFLVPPRTALWAMAAGLGWDVVPVIVQDPRWEQSFPDVGGLVLPVATPEGTSRPVRLTRREAAERRSGNEHRLRTLLEGFAARDIDPVLLSSHEPLDILAAFLRWHDRRRLRLRRR
ncbi:MAG TPA: DUF58 domain-containing protein [Gaiellaceae bacterium]|nr:DUF58 domain-containing protein [Gaiellaceae bacterium]